MGRDSLCAGPRTAGLTTYIAHAASTYRRLEEEKLQNTARIRQVMKRQKAAFHRIALITSFQIDSASSLKNERVLFVYMSHRPQRPP